MSQSKYHTRQNYETLYKRLYKEGNIYYAIPPPVGNLSDYQLLQKINSELKRLSCIPFTMEELEMELH